MRSINVRLIWRVARIFLIAYGLLLILMLLFENSLLYHTSKFPEGDWEPQELAYEDAWFKAADGTQLHGWFVPLRVAAGGSLVCPRQCRQRDRSCRFFAQCTVSASQCWPSITVVTAAVPGTPNEAGILADGRAAHKWLADHTETPESEIVLMGESLGGGVVVQLAAGFLARGLVLENTFSSLPDVAAAHYPWIPAKQLMRTQLNSADAIKKYHGPLLQFHGRCRRRIVPFKLGRKLFDAANDPKQFIIIPGGDHNDPRTPKYYQAVDQFLNQLPPRPAANITLKNEANRSVLPAERVQISQPPVVPELHEDKSSGASPSEKAPDKDMIKSLEESLLYFPSKFPAGNWSPAGLRFEDVWFKAADGTQLHGWFVPCDKPRAVALFAHGNGGNLSNRADILRDLHRLSVATLAFDYRGYGRSSGMPMRRESLPTVAPRAWLAERAKIPESEIVLMGESLGGAVAVQLASEAPARGLVLENTFSSVPDVAAFHYRWLPVKQLMRTQFDSVTAKRLVRGRGDEVRVRHRARVEARGDEAGEVGHVGHQQRADLVGDLAEPVGLDRARVGGDAADDQLRPSPPSPSRAPRRSRRSSSRARRRSGGTRRAAGEVHLEAVGEVAAVVEREPEHPVARLEHREVDGHVGLRTGVRLHVRVLGAEERLARARVQAPPSRRRPRSPP